MGAATARTEKSEAARNVDSAPPADLRDWLHERALTSEEVVRVLRRSDLTEEHITLIVGHHPWISYHKVAAGVVGNPATPRAVAQTYVYHLYWRELVDVIGNLRVHPSIRSAAENLLEDKIGEMSLGEKIALARTPQRGIVRAVRKMDSPEALKALVKNPALTEEDMRFVLTRPHVPVEVIEAVAATPKWRQRPGVCFEIIRQPRTPQRVALQLLAVLPSTDLREFSTSPVYPAYLREHARKLYLSRRLER